VLQAHGAWDDALAEVADARQRLSEPIHPALGLACYQQGELHRLRGDYDEAEQAFRAAAECGYEPAPGLALLRLAEGKLDAARGAITRLLAENTDMLTRPTLLAASVEICLAAGDLEHACAAADELRGDAETLDVPLVRAVAATATGTTLVARNEPAAGLPALRDGLARWLELDMPYEAARTRVQVAIACHALADEDAATIEFDAARATFLRLGARPEIERLDRVRTGAAPKPTTLTDRECEVLRLVATGRTNREIASELVISEHTVARHLQNIFLKLGLPTRAAAVAYAYEHGLA
jgi:DNA-binding NarL/FixJ family response regulator